MANTSTDSATMRAWDEKHPAAACQSETFPSPRCTPSAPDVEVTGSDAEHSSQDKISSLDSIAEDEDLLVDSFAELDPFAVVVYASNGNSSDAENSSHGKISSLDSIA